jgi:hypothetical protein
MSTAPERKARICISRGVLHHLEMTQLCEGVGSGEAATVIIMIFAAVHCISGLSVWLRSRRDRVIEPRTKKNSAELAVVSRVTNNIVMVVAFLVSIENSCN